MGSLEQDIETVRRYAREAFDRGDLVSWFFISCVLAGWRLARWLGFAR